MSEFFTVRGGAQVGYDPAAHVTWPLAQLTVTSEYIELDVLGKIYHFERQVVRGIRKFRAFLSTGIRILHSKPEYRVCCFRDSFIQYLEKESQTIRIFS